MVSPNALLVVAGSLLDQEAVSAWVLVAALPGLEAVSVSWGLVFVVDR